jgi:hypothetical protein
LCYQNRLNGSQTRLPQNANFEPCVMVKATYNTLINNQ